mgnify:FL=1
MIYAKEVPLIICIKKLIVGATLYLKAWGIIIKTKLSVKFKFILFAASHWPWDTAIIEPLQTSDR